MGEETRNPLQEGMGQEGRRGGEGGREGRKSKGSDPSPRETIAIGWKNETGGGGREGASESLDHLSESQEGNSLSWEKEGEEWRIHWIGENGQG